MALSPLQFAREWESTKSRLYALHASDSKLLLLCEFWPNLAGQAEKPTYQGYLDEFRSLLLPLIGDGPLNDLSPSELQLVTDIAEALARYSPAPSELSERIATIHRTAARVDFYVGDLASGLRHAAAMSGCATPALDLDELEKLSDMDALRILIERVAAQAPPIAERLTQLLREWQTEREAVTNEAVHCLLVESDGTSTAPRGRMKALRGDAETVGNHASGDKVTFRNVIVAPSDPFIGGAYKSLEAVRRLLSRQALHSIENGRIHANFEIIGADQELTGESMGLAFALVTFTQLLKAEVLRIERFNSNEVAVTGILDEDGELLPVNRDTLVLKVRRAFFSHVRYLALPEANATEARVILAQLQTQYPRRQLFIIGARTLAEIVADHNIVRSQKVCIGEWVGKQLAKYSRMAKVQVPMLALLAYLLLSVLFPKAWLFLDRNPAFARPILVSGTIEVFNADSTRLWSYSFPHAFNDRFTKDAFPLMIQTYDIDSDSDNEVLVIPLNEDDVEENAWLYCFDKAGNIRFRRYLAVPNEYPGDTDSTTYHGFAVYPVTLGGKVHIVTLATQILPARCHIRLWTADGDSLLWFIQSGGARMAMVKDIDNDGSEEIIFGAFGNRTGCATCFALNLQTKSGCSPPYEDPEYDLSRLKRAANFLYTIFPPTDLCNRDCLARYNQPGVIVARDRNGGTIDFYTAESKLPYTDAIYSLDSRLRARSVSFSDGFIDHRKGFVEEGKLSSISDSAYAAIVLGAVRYWTEEGWVSEAELRAREGENSSQSR